MKETENEMAIKLEGRIAGPWVAELGRTWKQAAPRLNTKYLLLDLSNVTYADVSGKQLLKDIYAQTRARLVANTPWTQFLAREIAGNNTD